MADRVLITGTASQEVKEGVLHSLQSHGYDAAIEDNAETINAAVAAPIVKGRRPALVMCVEEANCAATEGDDYSPNDDSSPQAFAKGDAASSANYHRRYFWRPGSSTVDEVVKMVDNAAAPPSLHRFTSTRGSAEGATFLLVVREGLARDGGLYVLKDLPTLAPSQLEHILYGSNANGGDLDYVDVAQVVMEYLVDDSITPPQLRPLLVEAYNRTRWSNLENLCPLTPLLCGQRSGRNPNNWPLFSSDDVHVLELFHGPTAAFKDFALQLFPRCFEVAVENDFQTRRQANAAEEKEAYLVLAATSGDTGVAAISGFVESAGSSQVMVLYPKSGVSPVQQIQMLSLDDGKKVRVFGVDGDFDFCQSSVKAIFKNTDLTAQLASQKPPRRLSSANSINWGRLVPQVVYYFWAYRQLVHRGAAVGSREVSPSASAADFDLQSSTRRMDVVIPCGNFGNLLAAYIARRMGLPIRRLIVASNSNDVLCDFIQTGVYDIADRGLLKTASPSIDILKASNIERFLFYLSEGNTELVSRLMLLLDQDQYFKLPEELHKKMSLYMWAGRCSEAECAQTIADVYEASGCTRLLDPHTAVAACVANAYLTSQAEATRRGEKEDCALLIASTAHWSKFPQPVLNAILHHGESSNDATGAGISSALPAAQVRQLYANILDTAKSAKAGTSTIAVHKALLDALTASESLKNPPRELNASLDEVVAQVSAFCSSTL